MAKKIKRFLVFVFFSFFFGMFSKKIQTTDSSEKVSTLTSENKEKSQKTFGQTLSSFVGVSPAEAGAYCGADGGWKLD